MYAIASMTGGDRDESTLPSAAANSFDSARSDSGHECVTNCHDMSLIATPHTETNWEINREINAAVQALSLRVS